MKPGNERFKLDEGMMAQYGPADTPEKIQYYEKEFSNWMQ
jgi:hypothetical protein